MYVFVIVMNKKLLSSVLINDSLFQYMYIYIYFKNVRNWKVENKKHPFWRATVVIAQQIIPRSFSFSPRDKPESISS